MRYKILVLFIVFNLTSTQLLSQTLTGDLVAYIEQIIDKSPDKNGNDFMLPTDQDLENWNTTLDFILQNNLVAGREIAANFQYQITEFSDNTGVVNQIYYILENAPESENFWGTYVFNRFPNRERLVIQAPHSQFDTNTGLEAAFCFRYTKARALFVNGTHRCNSSMTSNCSGTTSVCGSSAPYRKSDLAHNTDNMFQNTTDYLFRNVTNSTFVQLHGFAKKETDPYVIMSNGTRKTPEDDPILKLSGMLLAEDDQLTFEIGHINTSWSRLLGFTNTQGRLINDSEDYCESSAKETSGRFLHIEQEKLRLRENEGAWLKMAKALDNTFEQTLSSDNISPIKSFQVFPNPTFANLNIIGEGIKSIAVRNILGNIVKEGKTQNFSDNVTLDLSSHESGVYFISISAGKSTTSIKIIKQ